MVPLAREGSWLFIYNDELTQKRLINIPFGSCFILRSNVLHGGCCGSPGNTRLQVSFILHKMMDNYKELGHVDGRICFEKGFYDPPEVDYTKSVCLLGPELEDTVSKYHQVITNKFLWEVICFQKCKRSLCLKMLSNVYTQI